MSNKYFGSFEKSQFGGFRAVALASADGHMVYLSQASWITPEEAQTEGQRYADALNNGIKEPRTVCVGSYR